MEKEFCKRDSASTPSLWETQEEGKMGGGQGPGPRPPALPHTLAGFIITNGNCFPWSGGATLRSGHMTARRGEDIAGLGFEKLPAFLHILTF